MIESWLRRISSQGEQPPAVTPPAMTQVPTAAPATTVAVAELLRRADRLRDQRQWPEAAQAFRAVLDRDPANPAIWVQYGHACKESGQFDLAEAAYREALVRNPAVADTHLQLAHLLKMRGRRDEAIEEYARALRVDPGFRPALEELIGLGESWRAQQETGAGQTLLQELQGQLAIVRAALDRIERQVPPIASLASVVPARYDVFRALYRVSPPPALGGDVGPTWQIVVLDDGHGTIDLERLGTSLRPQIRGVDRLVLVSDRPDDVRLDAWTHVEMAQPATAQACVAEAIGASDCDWVLVADRVSCVAETALAWFRYAAAVTRAAVLYADEDEIIVNALGDPHYAGPRLFGVFDPDWLGYDGHAPRLVAYRRDVLIAALEAGKVSDGGQAALLRAAAGQGPVGHIPRVLSSMAPEPAQPAPALSAPPISGGAHTRIGVVIPTRNGVQHLRACVDSLLGTAADIDRIALLVIDNGSDDPETVDYLAEIGAAKRIRVDRQDVPFNWARLNNDGAALLATEIVVFANDDIEMLTPGWDAMLAAHLAEGASTPGIGCVGARLVYPDGRLQHAGIVFGPDGRSEHEGVGEPGDASGPGGRWQHTRHAAAVTGAFMACNAATFAAVGGFDAQHLPLWFNDVDFCLRARRHGLHVLYEPGILARHHESPTVRAFVADAEREARWQSALGLMRQRWGRAMAQDPGFNPHYARVGRPFDLLAEPSMDAVLRHLELSAAANPWVC